MASDSDQMLPQAASIVTETGRASTSMLQTKLKVGFNRATRLMDDLEKHGIIGPLDTRNPGAPRTSTGRITGCAVPRTSTTQTDGGAEPADSPGSANRVEHLDSLKAHQ